MKIGYDQFEVSLLEFHEHLAVHWKLKLHTFYHILPAPSTYKPSSGNRVELVIRKGVKIAWRNIHYEATVVYPNQYAWYEINKRFSGQLIDDTYIFKKAQDRIDEKNDER